MNIFTKDQSARMNATLSIAPYDKLATTGCTQNTDQITCKPLVQKISESIFTKRNIIIGLVIIVLIIIFVVLRKKKII
jgi:hypothetical protein